MKQGWETKKIGEVVQKIFAGGDKPHMFSERQTDICCVPVYGNGVTNDGLCGYTDHYVVNERCLTVSARGTVGYCCVRNEPFVPIVRLITIIPQESIGVEYLCYALSTIDIENNGVAIPQLTVPMIKNVSIPVPPIAEQEKIVAELDCLSGIIEKKKQQLKELDNLALSIFYEMFGDPVENDKGWEKKRLDEIGKVITGNTPSTKDESNYSSADYCFVKPSDIAKDSISYISNTEFYISEKAYVNSRQLPKGSVLTTCIGIIGKVGILKKDATCNQQINAIIPNKDIDAKFLAHVLFMIRDILTDVANAPIVPIINKKEFSSVSIPIPSFSLQQDFASKIESIEKQKELIAQSIKEAETLFNSRMAYYFG